MHDDLDGLLSFFASHHAIRAEKVLRSAGFLTNLIPGPKEMSPNCGVALRFEFDHRDAALAVLVDEHVQVDEVHEYRPRTDDWQRSGGARRTIRQSWQRRRP
jgi:hypothetical protein